MIIHHNSISYTYMMHESKIISFPPLRYPVVKMPRISPVSHVDEEKSVYAYISTILLSENKIKT